MADTKNKWYVKYQERLKRTGLLTLIHNLMGKGSIRILPHAQTRMYERNIIYYELLQALTNGKHIVRRDRYNVEFHSWEYCIEGISLDNRRLRIVASFETTKDSEVLLIITAIDLTK